jgi:hypothetical protein
LLVTPHGKDREAAANLDLAKLVDSGRVPAVAITAHTAQDTSLVDRVTVAARLTDRGGGRPRRVAHNGLTVGVVEQMAKTAGLPSPCSR